MTDALSDMIAEREARRQKLAGQLAAVDAELRVLRELQSRTSGASGVPHVAPDARAQTTPGKRDRKLQERWKKVLRFVGQSRGATLDDIDRFAQQNALGIVRNTLRSQLSIYKSREWLNRDEQGQFRLTDAGAEKCGYVGHAEGPTEVGPPQENGGGVVRAQVFPAERPGGPIPPTSTSHADDDELASIIGQPSGARPAQSEE